MFAAGAKESTEAEDGICDLACPFVDHKILDAADLLAVRAVHRCSFNLVAGNQIGRFVARNVAVLVGFGLSGCRHVFFSSAPLGKRLAGFAVPDKLRLALLSSVDSFRQRSCSS